MLATGLDQGVESRRRGGGCSGTLIAISRTFGLWVPETRLTSCDLPIFMEEAAEPVVAADAGAVDLAVSADHRNEVVFILPDYRVDG